MPKLRNGTKGDSNMGSLDCESGVLPLSYRAPRGFILLCFLSEMVIKNSSTDSVFDSVR